MNNLINWIDVDDELPEKKNRIIVTGDFGFSVEWYSHTLKEDEYNIQQHIFIEGKKGSWLPHWVTHWMIIPDDTYEGWHTNPNDIPKKWKSVVAITNKGAIKMYHGHGDKPGYWGWMRGGEDIVVEKWMYFPESPSIEDINKHNRNNELCNKLNKIMKESNLPEIFHE